MYQSCQKKGTFLNRNDVDDFTQPFYIKKLRPSNFGFPKGHPKNLRFGDPAYDDVDFEIQWPFSKLIT